MRCRVCGNDLVAGALFCGECGSSVTVVPYLAEDLADSRPSDTRVVQPIDRVALVGSGVRSGWVDARGGSVGAGGGSVGAGGVVDGRGSAVNARPGESARFEQVDPVDPIDPTAALATSFELRFSTGDRAVVHARGLLGRKPIAQPGEQPQQIIVVTDPDRSVSKTHLEFGVDEDDLWICDRYSGNGTIIHPPSGEPRVCDPGLRYRVPRAAWVEIGDQSFTVS